MKNTPKPQIPVYILFQSKNLPSKASITPNNISNKICHNLSTQNTLTNHLVSKHTQNSLEVQPFLEHQQDLNLSKNNSKANIKVLKPKKNNRVKSDVSEDSLVEKYSSLCNQRFENSYCNDTHQLSLYQKSLRSYSAKKSWLYRQHKRQQMKEIEQCTYNPKINSLSQEIVKKKKEKRSQPSRNSKKDNNINIYIKQKSEKQMLQCSFMPKVNNKKRKQANSQISQQSDNIFENLYKQSLTREKRKRYLSNSYYEEACKNPTINKISKSIMGKSKFNQRLQQYQQVKDMKHKKRLRTQNGVQKSMYQPKIGRAPANYNKQNLPIGQYLYERRKNIKNSSGNINQNKPNFVNKKSEQLYELNKKQAFEKIYDLLDQESIGYISLLNMNLINIPISLLQTLRPLLQELQILDTFLTKQQFILSLNNLFNTLPVSQKNIILKQAKSKNQIQQPSFQPFLNSKSLSLAKRMARGRMNIHEYCEMKKMNSQMIVKQIREQRVRREMQQCTFHPKVNEHY